MIGQQTLPLETRYHRLEIQNRWFIGLAVVAVIALVALGAWVLADRAAVSDAEATITTLTEAWSQDDPAALADVYAEDAVLVSGTEYRGLPAIQTVLSMVATEGFAPEVAGDVVQYGDMVAAPIHFTWEDGTEEDAMSVFRIGADGKIVYHEDFSASLASSED
jgi:uncharacterized protein (TIGR02246 family)